MRANVLRVLVSGLGRGSAARPLARNRDGAVGVYVAVIAAVMVGMVGMAIDFGRFGIVNTQAQDAADASALAAASQLDGTATATTRAYNAAQAATGLVTNNQALSGNGGNVTIAAVDFLSALPASDTTPITSILCSGTGCTAAQSTQAHFVRVTTQRLSHQNWFVPVVGAGSTGSTVGIAVAGNTPVMCQPTPIFICNPQEAPPPDGQGLGAGFDISTWQGRQILMTQGGGSTWAPGNYGLLDTNCGGATKCLADELASTPSGASCIKTVSPKTGNVTPVNAAINTRFDVWFPPGFKNPTSVPSSQLPAADVVKGLIPGTTGGSGKVDCSSFVPPAGTQVQAIPRDNSFTGANNAFGNGQWNCAAYWSANHGPTTPTAAAQPLWCTGTTNATVNYPTQTRFAMYKEELGLNSPNIGIPNNSALASPQGPGEDGRIPEQPQACATSTWSPPSGCSGGDPDLCTTANRRLLWFAVIDCLADGINGGSVGNVTPIAFVKGFITEPVGYVPGQPLNSSSNQNMYMELVAEANPGNGLLHPLIQLYR